MLVTVSGMVGSGKSTTATHVVSLLRKGGHLTAEAWNFRALPCFQWRQRTARRSEPGKDEAAAISPMRWTGYRLRRLTFTVTAGYAVRMLAFRLYRRRHGAGPHVCNRFFYDSIAHYELRTPLERLWLRLLRWTMPRPDLAILMTASPSTIRSRRPTYSDEYLQAVWRAYHTLPQHFPELVVVSTDNHSASSEILRLVKELE